MSEQDYARLRQLAADYRIGVFNVMQVRELRDALALELIEAGETWRAVAEAAGFENPYIAQLKKKTAGHAKEAAGG